MKNKSHPQVTFKWSRVDEGLLLSAFSAPKASHVYRIARTYSDAAKISFLFITSKFFETFLQKKQEIEHFLSNNLKSADNFSTV